MATDAKQSGEDVPAVGRPSTAPATPLRADDRDPRPTPDLTMLHRKARVALDEVIMPGEEPRLLIPGLAASAIVATDSRAFVFKAGARAGLPFGARLKIFEYESVMRVDLRPAGDIDVVVIHAPLKISTCSSYWADPRDDPWKARNAIVVTRGSKFAEDAVEELSRLVKKVHDRRAASRAERSPQRSSSGDRTPDVVGRIAELEQRGGRAEIASVPRGPDSQPSAEECSRCGTELGDGWDFCPGCGTPAKAPGDAPREAAANAGAKAAAKAGRRERAGQQRRRHP